MPRTHHRRMIASPLALFAGLTASLTGCGMVRSLVFVEPDQPQPRTLITSTDPATGTDTTPPAASDAYANKISRDAALVRAAIEPRRPAQPFSSTSALALNAETFGERPTPTTSQRALGTPESPNVAQITYSHTGGVYDPSISRDGRLLAFASTQHRPTSDIYLQRVGARVVTQLTTSDAQDAMPVISPDGTRVAFASDRNGNWDIFVIPITGGRALQITGDSAHEVHPSWSPDGSKLVFSRLGVTSGRWEMWVVDTNNSAVSQFIGYGLFPEWCPVSGTGLGETDQIAFQLNRERGDRAYSIWTIDYADGIAGSPTEIASSGSAALINPSWSPDGKRLVFAGIPNDGSWTLGGRDMRPHRADIWMIDLDGTDLVKLTDGSTTDLMPTWTAHDTVIFASDRGGQENLWSLDVRDAVALAEGRTPERASSLANAPEDAGN